MKTILKLAIIIILIALFGSLPLKIVGVAFEWLSAIVKTVANWIDFFGFGGII